QRRSSVSASPCKCASFQSFSNWISSFLVSFVPVSASAWGNAKQQAQTKNNAKCPRVLIRMTLRHTRHALPIEPDLADAFDAGEDVIDGLTADSYQLCSHYPSNEIAWEIENLLRRRAFQSLTKNSGHRPCQRLHFRTECHANVCSASFVHVQINTDRICAFLVLAHIDEFEIFALVGLLLPGIIRV